MSISETGQVNRASVEGGEYITSSVFDSVSETFTVTYGVWVPEGEIILCRSYLNSETEYVFSTEQYPV